MFYFPEYYLSFLSFLLHSCIECELVVAGLRFQHMTFYFDGVSDLFCIILLECEMDSNSIHCLNLTFVIFVVLLKWGVVRSDEILTSNIFHI